MVIPFPVNDPEVYSLHFRYRSTKAFALQVWDVDDKLAKLENLSLYNDRIPESHNDYSEFHVEVFFYSRRGQGGALFIAMPESEQAIQAT